jgi:hypothetical protein
VFYPVGRATSMARGAPSPFDPHRICAELMKHELKPTCQDLTQSAVGSTLRRCPQPAAWTEAGSARGTTSTVAAGATGTVGTMGATTRGGRGRGRGRVLEAIATSGGTPRTRHGLTLVHFSAQPKPCLAHKDTLRTLHTPKHPLYTGDTTHYVQPLSLSKRSS